MKLGNISDAGTLTRVVERLYTLYGRYYEQEDQERIEKMFPGTSVLESALKGCADYGCVFDRFMRLQMEDASKYRWGNNAPRDLFSVRDIREMFPDAKYVVCVRDIRAFLLSYQGKWKVTGESHVERLKKLYHPVVTSYLWKSSMRQIEIIERIVPPADFVIVRYEDLVTAPEDTIRVICETIEEEFDPVMLEVTTHNSSDARRESGIFSTSIDRWRTSLTPEEIAISQYIGCKELHKFKYLNEGVVPNKIRMLGLWLTTPIALWKALEANKDVRGPLIPYLTKRVSSLIGINR